MLTSTPYPDTQQRERLQALYHLAVELSALRDLQLVMDTALRHCLELTDSQFGFVGLNTLDGKALDVVAIQGFHPSPDFYANAHLIPLRPNVFARVVLENHPVRSDDARNDPFRVGQPRGHPPVQAFLGVPLLVREQPIGMIGVANRPAPYDDDHEQLLTTYAAQVAIAITNAQLYEKLGAANTELERQVAERTQELNEAKEALAQKAEQLQRLLSETVSVQERERQRISQDMHDGLNQLLIGALLELKSSRERLGAGEPERAEISLGQVKDILLRMEREIKQTVHDLRPPSLDALGLVPSLRRYAERFTQYSGIPCTVRAEGDPHRLPPDVEIGLYRIMQESLQNVSVHSRARYAEVVVGFLPSAVILTIADDGRGFEPASTNGDGLGLIGMRERVENLGGRFMIESAPGKGARVHLSVPIHTPSYG